MFDKQNKPKGYVIKFGANLYFEGVGTEGRWKGQPLWGSRGPKHVFESRGQAQAMKDRFPNNTTMEGSVIIPLPPELNS